MLLRVAEEAEELQVAHAEAVDAQPGRRPAACECDRRAGEEEQLLDAEDLEVIGGACVGEAEQGAVRSGRMDGATHRRHALLVVRHEEGVEQEHGHVGEEEHECVGGVVLGPDEDVKGDDGEDAEKTVHNVDDGVGAAQRVAGRRVVVEEEGRAHDAADGEDAGREHRQHERHHHGERPALCVREGPQVAAVAEAHDTEHVCAWVEHEGADSVRDVLQNGVDGVLLLLEPPGDVQTEDGEARPRDEAEGPEPHDGVDGVCHVGHHVLLIPYRCVQCPQRVADGCRQRARVLEEGVDDEAEQLQGLDEDAEEDGDVLGLDGPLQLQEVREGTHGVTRAKALG
eukprot:PhM_4_TR8455/c0_g1_i1/m.1866